MRILPAIRRWRGRKQEVDESSYSYGFATRSSGDLSSYNSAGDSNSTLRLPDRYYVPKLVSVSENSSLQSDERTEATRPTKTRALKTAFGSPTRALSVEELRSYSPVFDDDTTVTTVVTHGRYESYKVEEARRFQGRVAAPDEDPSSTDHNGSSSSQSVSYDTLSSGNAPFVHLSTHNLDSDEVKAADDPTETNSGSQTESEGDSTQDSTTSSEPESEPKLIDTASAGFVSGYSEPVAKTSPRGGPTLIQVDDCSKGDTLGRYESYTSMTATFTSESNTCDYIQPVENQNLETAMPKGPPKSGRQAHDRVKNPRTIEGAQFRSKRAGKFVPGRHDQKKEPFLPKSKPQQKLKPILGRATKSPKAAVNTPPQEGGSNDLVWTPPGMDAVEVVESSVEGCIGLQRAISLNLVKTGLSTLTGSS